MLKRLIPGVLKTGLLPKESTCLKAVPIPSGAFPILFVNILLVSVFENYNCATFLFTENELCLICLYLFKPLKIRIFS